MKIKEINEQWREAKEEFAAAEALSVVTSADVVRKINALVMALDTLLSLAGTYPEDLKEKSKEPIPNLWPDFFGATDAEKTPDDAK